MSTGTPPNPCRCLNGNRIASLLVVHQSTPTKSSLNQAKSNMEPCTDRKKELLKQKERKKEKTKNKNNLHHIPSRDQCSCSSSSLPSLQARLFAPTSRSSSSPQSLPSSPSPTSPTPPRDASHIHGAHRVTPWDGENFVRAKKERKNYRSHPLSCQGSHTPPAPKL